MFTIWRYEHKLDTSFPVRDENNEIRSFNHPTEAAPMVRYLNSFPGSDTYYIAADNPTEEEDLHA
jgi:hypothetical protein